MTAIAEHRRAASDVAHRLGLPEPKLVRANEASLWRAGNVALRVAPQGTGAKLILLAKIMMAHEIPTTQPVFDAPYLLSGLEVTGWRWVNEISRHEAVPWRLVGSTVRRLHRISLDAVDAAGVSLDSVQQVESLRIRRRLNILAGHVETDLLSLLQAEAERYFAVLEELSAGSTEVILHGDLNPGNVMVSTDGPILIDWELARIGPPHWDHVPLLIHVRRFGVPPGIYHDFAAGYQETYERHPLTEAMCRLRELSITLGQLRRSVIGSDPQDQAEAERRVQYWTSPEAGEKLRWTAR